MFDSSSQEMEDNTDTLTREVSEPAKINESTFLAFDVTDTDSYDFSPIVTILPPTHTIIRNEVIVEDVNADDDDLDSASMPPPTPSEDPINERSETSKKHYNLCPRRQVDYALKTMAKQFLQTTVFEYPELNHIKSAKKKAKLKLKMKKIKAKLVVRDVFKKIVAVCFNQMSARKGIKLHG